MQLDEIQTAIRDGRYIASGHALNEASAEQIIPDDIWDSLLQVGVEIIEDYPQHMRGPCCLLLSFIQGRPLHSVVA